jgi:CheY-like chemotaxis protein
MQKRILVIEDEESLAQGIKSFLSRHGYQVVIISEGVSGLEDIRKERPDLILTDLLLPRIHGFDICRSVKSDSELKDVPLVIMTAVYKNAIHKLEAKRLGVRNFVEKPFNFDDLLKTIERIFGSDIDIPETIETESENKKEAVMQEEFEGIQKKFADNLPGKILQMEEVWENVLMNKDTTKQLAKLRRLVHSLTGSGTTFGFKEISEQARELELTVDMIIAEGENTIGQRKDKISQLLDNLRHHPMISTELEIMRQEMPPE